MLPLTVSTAEMLDLWKKQVTVLASFGKGMTIETKWSHSLTAEQTPCVYCEVNRHLFSRDESYRISVSATQVIMASITHVIVGSKHVWF